MESLEIWKQNVQDLNHNLQICARTLQTLAECVTKLCEIQTNLQINEGSSHLKEAGEYEENFSLRKTSNSFPAAINQELPEQKENVNEPVTIIERHTSSSEEYPDMTREDVVKQNSNSKTSPKLVPVVSSPLRPLTLQSVQSTPPISVCSTADDVNKNEKDIYRCVQNKVGFNVGGHRFVSTRSTLSRAQDSMLAAYASGRFQGQKDELGYWFIDRDPTHFRHILNFLRDGTHILHSGGLLQHPPYELRQVLIEANFYHIKQLADAIKSHLEKLSENRALEPTHEKEYKLIKDVSPSELEAIFTDYTNQDYDFESMHEVKVKKNQTVYYMIFSKKLNRGEISFLERLSLSLR